MTFSGKVGGLDRPHLAAALRSGMVRIPAGSSTPLPTLLTLPTETTGTQTRLQRLKH
jgi:hypothetical protein